LYFKITPIGGIASYKNNLFKRLNQLTVGFFNYLPLNYTYSGYFMPFILGKKKQYFFTKIGHFLFTKRYIYFLNKFNKNFFLIKQFNIFPIRTPNLTLKILYFYFSSKKLNFIKNNILFIDLI
jgi:hypothetical protein